MARCRTQASALYFRCSHCPPPMCHELRMRSATLQTQHSVVRIAGRVWEALLSPPHGNRAAFSAFVRAPAICTSPFANSQICVDVCDGLLFSHGGCGRGPTTVLLHRDVKPSNVLLHRDRDGRLVAALGGFGLSKLCTVGMDSSVATTGAPYGTVGYIAPEVNEGAPPSTLSDAYALGVTILQVGDDCWLRLTGGR